MKKSTFGLHRAAPLGHHTFDGEEKLREFRENDRDWVSWATMSRFPRTMLHTVNIMKMKRDQIPDPEADGAGTLDRWTSCWTSAPPPPPRYHGGEKHPVPDFAPQQLPLDGAITGNWDGNGFWKEDRRLKRIKSCGPVMERPAVTFPSRYPNRWNRRRHL